MKLRIFALLIIFTNCILAQNFHDTQGKLEITNDGQASYTLPIALPPSIQSVGPQINLNYVSGQMGGIAGQGWSISGVSGIARTSSRKDIDKFIDGVDYDEFDKLSFNGQRLILVPGTGNYWDENSFYETEIHSNTKFQLKGTGSNIYFIVTAPDGSKSFYGNYEGNNGTDLSVFYIVKFEDTNGNYILYNYLKPFGKSLCINKILFSANYNSNNLPTNSIDFFYEAATRSEFSYLKGEKIEKVELLDRIEVKIDNQLFKKYEIEQNVDNQLGYQRVSKIQEYNGENEPANPIIFEYEPTQTLNSEITKTFSNNFNLNDTMLNGDFDGDGSLDFITQNQLYIKTFESTNGTAPIPIPYSANRGKRFSATTLTNNKLNQFQSIVMVDEEIDKINFKIYNYNANTNTVENTNTKTLLYDNVAFCSSDCNIQCISDTYAKTSNRYFEGDFNGDGISEVLVLEFDEIKTFKDLSISSPTGRYPVDCAPVISSSPNFNAKLVDLNINSSSTLGQSGFLNIPNATLFYKKDPVTGLATPYFGKLTIADFNGDGKSDILINYGADYKIVTFRETVNAPYIELEIIGQGTLDSNSLEKTTQLFGDYNGDGKTDLMVPEGDGTVNGQSNWFIYFSNPKPDGSSFFDKQIHNIVDYRPSTGSDFNLSTQANFYYAVDTNKDGKTDLVKIWVNYITRKCAVNDHDTEWRVTTFANNIGNNNTPSKFTLDYDSPTNRQCFDRCPMQNPLCFDYHWDDSPELVTPIVSSYKFDGLNREVLLLRNHTNTLTYINFTKDVSKDNLLKKVTQSNGSIIDEITYSPLEPAEGTNGNGILSDFYSSTNSEQFPNIEVIKLPKSNYVSKLSNTSNGISRYQTFKYHGYVTQIGQLGALGFKKTVRSNWISNDANKISWNVTECNPSFRGAVIKNYIYVLDKNINFTFNTSYLNGLVSQTENIFTQSLDGNTGKYLLLNTSQKTTDFLTNVIRETINDYSPIYYLPSKTTTNNYLGTQLQGSIINEIIFDNTAPYIGRPADIVKTSILYANTVGAVNTKFVNEKLIYTNNNISKKETNSNNSAETLVENYEYFPNGNLKKKTLTAIGTAAALALQPRSTEYTYDSSNRYIETVKDVELLVTKNNSFHPLYGMVLSQTNPYGQMTTSIYDNWGKRIKVTDFLGKSINYTYSKINNVYKTLQVGDDGSESFIESDALSREIKKGEKDINGNWNYVVSEYDYLGRKYKVSEPFSSTQFPTQWTINEYDDYSRVIKTTAHTGRVGMISYNGLSVTTNDGVLIKTTLKNANNHVISSTDNPGGTILYYYDANGNLLKSNYDGIELKMTYDNWGRKLSLDDPSAGIYTNTYNAFSEMLTEGTPKGNTTFTYTDSGKILTKRIVGSTSVEKTDILSTYNYDATNKWLNSIDVLNTYDGNSSYTYTYDATTKQLKKTVEVTPQAIFTKELTFDAFGRVSTEEINTTVISNNKTSNKTLKHTYKNGSQWQIIDNATNLVIWQVNSENQRGQLTNATLGNGINVSNSYDVYGFPSQIKHDKTGATPVNIMTLNSSFEQTRGNLLSRSSSLFNINESFKYDNLDRLTKWEDGSVNILTLPFNTTTDGFTFTTTSNYGSVTNSAGTLKVVLKGLVEPEFPIGAERNLAFGLTNGNKIRVKATISNKTGSGKVFAVIVETDPNDSSNFTENVIGEVNNGIFDQNYTISDFVPNPVLKIRFIVVSSGASNGGGIIIPQATFYVDNLSIDKTNLIQQSYDDRGRITENNNGKYNYTISNKPYQHASILPMTADAKTYFQAREKLYVTYNAFKSPIQIEDVGNDKISFDYNAMQQRSAMYYGNINTDKLTRPYRKYFSADGSVEIKYTVATGVTEIITYVGGDAYSAPAIVKSDGTTQNYFYLHRDYLGSIVAITNTTGNIVEKRYFDAWGEIKKIQDGAGNNLSKLTFFDRGYTGHEHLQGVNLIHMNGRLYDPKLHRFMQPDNYVQDPFNTQNYNRYSYVLNNPLKHTDPSGEEFIALTIAVAVAISVSIYTIDALYGGKPFNIQGVIKTSAIAAFSAAMTFGFGEITATITNFYARATAQAILHASFNGGMSYIQGGKFWSGFAAGGISSVASSAFTGGENLDSNSNPIKGSGFKGANFKVFGAQLNQSTVGLLTFGSISGGAGSLIGGGNFWQGAVTGLVVSGLNHAMNHGNKSTDIESQSSYLAKMIADKYGYNVSEVEIFLNKYQFEKTHEGVKFLGFEAKSSKFGGGKVNNFISKEGSLQIGGSILKKILGKGAGFLLTSGKLGEGTESYQVREARYIETRNRLIEHVFSKPYEYQVPSMTNGMQSLKYHSSIYDKMWGRFY